MTPVRVLVGLLRANAPVLWTWVASSTMVFSVQMGLGLGRPSEGLALSSAALPALLVAAMPPRLRRWGMVAVVTLTALVGLVNTLHHRAFQTYLPLTALPAVGQGWSVRGYAFGLLGPADLILAAIVAATLGSAWPGARLLQGPTPSRSGSWTRTALPVGVCLLGSLPAFGWAWLVAPGRADTQTGSFLYSHLLDAGRLAGEHLARSDPSPGEMALILRHVDADDTLLDGDPWSGRAAGANVLMVQVEALNGWVLDAEVGGEPVAPFLRALAAQGLSFPNVFDDTHQGRSSDADYLALVSQHPLRRDAVAMVRPRQSVVALPGLLRERGYATLAVHAHIPGFWNAGERRERYGFDTQLFGADLGPGEELGFGLVDAETLRRALPRLTSLPEPWVGWIVTLTMHGPHDQVPPSFPALPLGVMEGTPLGNYLRKVRHTDDALRRLLASLDSAGTLDRTLVVVYGDHTESHRMDMEWVERTAGVEGLPGDARTLLLDRVPLVILPPDPGGAAPDAPPEAGATSAGGRVVPAVGGLLDVAPTVLDLLGLERPRPFMGRSLLRGGRGLAAQASGEVVGDGLMWTGAACYSFPEALRRPAEACADLAARAREELDASWLITRYGLGPELAGR